MDKGQNLMAQGASGATKEKKSTWTHLIVTVTVSTYRVIDTSAIRSLKIKTRSDVNYVVNY